MVDIRLKDLLTEAQHVNRFIATTRDAKEADRFGPVMDYFATCLSTWTHTQREVFKKCGDKKDDAYWAELARLADEDLKHDHVAVPIQEMGQISIDVLNALIKLGVITRG